MPASQFRGRVDNINSHNGAVHGWAINLRAPTQPAILHILVDGQEVMQVRCDHPREDVRKELGAPSNRVGFQFVLPGSALDGMPHTLSLRFDDRSALLFPDPGNPGAGLEVITFTQTTKAEYASYVDGLQEGFLRGWVITRQTPDDPWSGNIAISVTADGFTLGTFRADHYRGDVATSMHCEPNCGFEIPIPHYLLDGLPHEFILTSLPDKTPLTGSPFISPHVDDQLTAQLVQIENGITKLHRELTALRRKARALIPQYSSNLHHYDQWARQYFAKLAEQTALHREVHPLQETPLVSIICPTWQAEALYLREAVNSIRAQSYENWELIIIDDGNNYPASDNIIKEICKEDKRIKSVCLKTNKGISTATNAGIKKAKGDYIAFLDHDDLLVPSALEIMVRAALKTGAKLLYSDEDHIDMAGHYQDPNLKPDYDYRYLLGCNYICHFLFIEAATARKIGPFETRYDGAQDHDFLLRATEILPREAIHHVAEILYHWRRTPDSTASDSNNKSYAVEAGKACITAHLKRRGINASVSAIGGRTFYSIRWPFRRSPSLSVIIPFRDQKEMTQCCVDSLLASQRHRNFEIILVDNFSVEPETISWLAEIGQHRQVSILRVEEAFNYSRLNNLAAKQSRSDLLLFLNNDVIITQPDFLTRLINETVASPNIGAVGAKLLYPNGTIQHAGVTVGPDVVGAHVHRLQPATEPGYVGRIYLSHEVTAITGAVLLTPRTLFKKLGGFDETNLTVAFNDIDLCLKIRDSGHRIIYCAEAEAVHHESYSRGSDEQPDREMRFFHEIQFMKERWKENLLFKNDPAYPHYFRQKPRTFFSLRTPDELWS